ncbi:MAG: hypothetical protein KGM43_14765 [Planctomycetota bacterium]|nr:hypothetical protein [Planctomycetota bacterium]
MPTEPHVKGTGLILRRARLDVALRPVPPSLHAGAFVFKPLETSNSVISAAGNDGGGTCV